MTGIEVITYNAGINEKTTDINYLLDILSISFPELSKCKQGISSCYE